MAPQGNLFTTIRSEGGLLPPDLLARIAEGKDLPGQDAEAYGLAPGERLNEVISRAWEHARAYWAAWQAAREGATGTGISELREQWLLPLFRELGYGRLVYRPAAEEIDGRRYAISHRAGEDGDAPPMHTVAPGPGLDTAARADGAGPRRSPHGLLQEYLNASPHLWGIVTDGETLRLLRDNASLSRAAYVEADLDAMFREGVYADFVLLYLLLHRSRLSQPGQPVEEAWLEVWRRESEASGARAREALRGGVETAIRALGQGLLEHRDNAALRERLTSGELSVQGYYRQLLRLVYRLIFLLAAEERDLLFTAGADPRQKRIYAEYYGIGRLRELARRRSRDRHDDLWQGVAILFRALREPEAAAILGLSPLGALFDETGMGDVDGRDGQPAAKLANKDLLAALRGLGWIEADRVQRRVNYRDMDVEELGSVYEGLLELQPSLSVAGERPEFTLGASGERKTTGSYYTNPGLVRELIRSALEPVIEGALARGTTKEERRANLLDLKVCDPACGSGHFLLATARRIGRALAEAEAEGDEPTPDGERAAIREAIGHCVYGVDLNELAVDLCKVALWLEGQNAGKPLQFLDHHIRHGNSLLGATSEAMAEGIPDAAFDPVTGDSKPYAGTIKKRNREERKRRGQRALEELGWQVTDVTDADDRRRYFTSLAQDDITLEEVARKAARFYRHQHDRDFLRRKLTAHLWTAAFFWPLEVGEANPPTDAVWRRLAEDPRLTDYIDRRLTERLKDQADFRTVRQAYRLARDHRFFHWELEFEDVFGRPDPGFDVILGNPPWERIKLQEQEFFAQREPDIAAAPNAAARKRLIASLPETNPSLFAAFEAAKRASEAESVFLRGSGCYSLTGRGDINTYSVFSEANTAHIRRAGRAGFIVPTGIATDDTNKAFFASLVAGRKLSSLFDFENRENLFPGVGHGRFRFTLLTLAVSGDSDGTFRVSFYLTQPTQLADPARLFNLSAEDIALLNPNTRTAPIFRTARDAAITKQIYRAAPVLVREGPEEVNPWGVTFKRMFDMSNDSHLFRTREEPAASGSTLDEDGRFQGSDGSWLRLYEAKMIHQFDHRYGDYADHPEGAETSHLPKVPADRLANPRYLPEPRYWVPETDVRHAAGQSDGRERGWFLGFRDIARATDERTAIFSVIPFAAVGHTLPLLLASMAERLEASLLANMNSIVLDFACRQKSSGAHLTFFIVKQLPVLPPETYTPALLDIIVPRVLELVYTAWDLAPFARDLGYEGDPFPWDEERRAILRAELDGLYAHLYGLSRDDFDYILGTFPIVNRNDLKAHGEERTRRLCLEAYDYYAKAARDRLWSAVQEIEIRLSQVVVKRLNNDLSKVPENIQESMEAERTKQGKPPRASDLRDFLGSGYLTLVGRVIKANRDVFADWFVSNGQVDDHLGPLVMLRNTLAHPKEAQLPGKVRTSGEAEVRWFAGKLGIQVDVVPPVAI